MISDIAKYFPYIVLGTVAVVAIYCLYRKRSKPSGSNSPKIAAIPPTPKNDLRVIDLRASTTIEELKAGYAIVFGAPPEHRDAPDFHYSAYEHVIETQAAKLIAKGESSDTGKAVYIYEQPESEVCPTNITPMTAMTGGGGDNHCYFYLIHTSHWTTVKALLGAKGIYKHTSTTNTEQIHLLIQISEEFAKPLYRHALENGLRNVVSIKKGKSTFPKISFDAASNSYLLCMEVKQCEYRDQGYQFVWPLVNMPQEVFDAFKALMCDPDMKGKNFTVYNAMGYTHVECTTPTRTLVYSDKTAWFNEEQLTQNQPVGMGTQLLTELEEKITEPGWVTIEPHDDKVIAWYLNPTLNQKVTSSSS